MIAFPNAKINLGLQVVNKRPDGFHNLISGFYPVPWQDAVEVIKADELAFTASGLPVPGDANQNLCLKAYHLLKEAYSLPPVHLHLHKVIPMGAGLGGGSADAAFVLKLLNDLFELKLSEEELENFARRLGSDCAFFIQNKPELAVEKGDVFEPLELDLKGYHCLIVHPGLHISTAEAYGNVKPQQPELDLKEILQQKPETWKEVLQNDFETALFPRHPQLQELKHQLYELGAVYASMTGSGSAFFGLFPENVPKTLPFPKHYSVWKGLL